MAKNDVTSTQTNGTANPQVTNTLNGLLGKLNEFGGQGPPQTFGQSLFSPAGSTTQHSWQNMLGGAQNPAFAAGMRGAFGNNNELISGGGLNPTQTRAMDTLSGLSGRYNDVAQKAKQPGIIENELMSTARGDFLNGNDPRFERDLSRSLDKAGAGVNASVGGRFGSGMHVDALARTLAGVDDAARLKERNSALDRQYSALGAISGERQQGTNTLLNTLGARTGITSGQFGMGQQGVNNAQGAGLNLESLFKSSLLPATTQNAVGAQQDANAQGILTGRANLHNTNNSNNLDWLSKLTSIFGGTAPFGGTTQTSTQPGTPWWQSLLGTGTALAGAFL